MRSIDITKTLKNKKHTHFEDLLFLPGEMRSKSILGFLLRIADRFHIALWDHSTPNYVWHFASGGSSILEHLLPGKHFLQHWWPIVQSPDLFALDSTSADRSSSSGKWSCRWMFFYLYREQILAACASHLFENLKAKIEFIRIVSDFALQIVSI